MYLEAEARGTVALIRRKNRRNRGQVNCVQIESPDQDFVEKASPQGSIVSLETDGGDSLEAQSVPSTPQYGRGGAAC